ncbi:ferrous iron transport protein B [Gloeocapsa sp. PCC 73106]|uniref:ferrous iron transport protein B n=1 Tax=Gloeocapsa sp. PCC 73106 TaxID=102232 RepID=UPI0002AC460C|nr:ferrous iron transport protein B [Gloeocapsa sp. PCC 73106]ELR98628.1 ferrous iron transporter FeoB [Gloeocapsa sp. PCC 73106]
MTQCHSGATLKENPNATKRIGVIGQPNTGKSTFFNRITGANAGVANWPGLTVDLMKASVELHDEIVEFVDLPGIYDLNGFSDDEKVVQKFLETYAVNLILVVLNASQIDRQIRMPLQIKALGLPAVVVLNMADEAKRYGVKIDAKILSDRLGMPVYPISAKYGTGCAKAISGISHALEEQPNTYQVENLLGHLQDNPITDRDLETTLEGAVEMPSINAVNFTNRLDQVMLHPIWGLPLFFLTMLGVFWLIWSIGIPSADPVDAVTGWLLENIVEPVINFLPEIVQDLIINGIWGGIAAVISFVPLVGLFFVAMSVLEDSGYLSRAAYLMDALMSRLGLDGRAFVLQMMGFGCNVPAIMGTRVMRSRGMRLLSMLVITFSLCSARLQVFVFILAVILPGPQGAIALFLLYVLSFVVAMAVAAILSNNKHFKSNEPFVLELPPYRIPTLKQVALRVWNEMKSFMQRVTTFILVGTILMWILTSFPEGAEGLDTLAGKLGQVFAPIMEPIGINPFLTVSLIFGFVAKEVQIAALAVIYGLSEDLLQAKLSETITFAQGFSYCLFSLIYIPCLTTISTIWGETRSVAYTIFSMVFPLVLAWVMCLIFYQGSHLLGIA